MATDRMSREEFFARLAALDEERLKKALWNLYWRGAAPVRARIEEETAPLPQAPKARSKPEVPSADRVCREVGEFVTLVRSGSYMAGDRRVHQSERSRWRLTFRQHIADARAALTDPDPGPAEEALEQLIDLTCAMKDGDYVHSQDPVAAARVVVSDLVADLWASLLRRHGMEVFAERAMAQLIRWEQAYGWTRVGYGAVAEQEVTLASVVVKLLPAPDAWIACADAYLAWLDRLVPSPESSGRRSAARTVSTSYDPAEYARARRGDNLVSWHELLLERLPDYDAVDRLVRIAEHPALASTRSGIVVFQARVALLGGDVGRARELVTAGLEQLPGHAGFHQLAAEIGAEVPDRARDVMQTRMWASSVPITPDTGL